MEPAASVIRANTIRALYAPSTLSRMQSLARPRCLTNEASLRVHSATTSPFSCNAPLPRAVLPTPPRLPPLTAFDSFTQLSPDRLAKATPSLSHSLVDGLAYIPATHITRQLRAALVESMTNPNAVPHSPSHSAASANNSIALARQAVAKRTAERNSISKKRRSPIKIVDSINIIELVVSGPRGNGKFMCPLCASTFGRRCELKRHVAEVHTVDGARRFSCKHPSCGKSFTRKDALAKHETVKHQGKKRFVCPTCSEKFTSRYDLSRHNIRVHSNVKKRFTCEFCSAGFSQKSQLTMHKGRVHTPRRRDTDVISTHSSMDSLAAAAAAVAREDERQEQRRQLDINQASTSKLSGPPTQQREAADAKVSSAKLSLPSEEVAAATLAANTLLQAAAVLQPVPTNSTTTTTVTEMTTSLEDKHVCPGPAASTMALADVSKKVDGSQCTSSTIVENSSA